MGVGEIGCMGCLGLLVILLGFVVLGNLNIPNAGECSPEDLVSPPVLSAVTVELLSSRSISEIAPLLLPVDHPAHHSWNSQVCRD